MLLSNVILVFNEEQVLPLLRMRIPDALHGIKMPGFRRNFRHQPAGTAGCVFPEMIPIALGAGGDSVARIYEESKGRPLYVANSVINPRAPQEGMERAIFPESSQPAVIVTRKSA